MFIKSLSPAVFSRTMLGLAALALVTAACPGGDTTKKIGVVLPLTGDDASYGVSIREGLEVGLEAVNAREDILFPFTLDIQDSGSSAEGAVTALDTAISGSMAVIGGATSSEALALVPVVERADKVLISPTASSPELSGASQNFFRIFPNSDAEAVAITQLLREKDWLQPEMVVALQAEDDYSAGAVSALMAKLDEGTETATITFPVGSTDLSAQAAEAIASFGEGDDAKKGIVFVGARGGDLVTAVKALRDGGWSENSNWIFVTSAVSSPDVMGPLGNYASRLFFVQGAYDPNSDQEPVASFVQAYETKFGKKPDLSAAHGYDAIQVLAQAVIERALPNPLPSDLLPGMRAISNYTGVTGTIQFRESGDVQKFARVYYVNDTDAGREVVDYNEWEKQRLDDARRRMEEIRKKEEELNRRLRQMENG